LHGLFICICIERVLLTPPVQPTGSALITAAAFCMNGQLAVAGTYDGRCVFFRTGEGLKYHTQISIKARSRTGRKRVRFPNGCGCLLRTRLKPRYPSSNKVFF